MPASATKSKMPRNLEMKWILVKKYENLIKSIKSKPRKAVYLRRVDKYRRQAEQLERLLAEK